MNEDKDREIAELRAEVRVLVQTCEELCKKLEPARDPWNKENDPNGYWANWRPR